MASLIYDTSVHNKRLFLVSSDLSDDYVMVGNLTQCNFVYACGRILIGSDDQVPLTNFC